MNAKNWILTAMLEALIQRGLLSPELIDVVIKDADRFATGKLWIKWNPKWEMFECKMTKPNKNTIIVDFLMAMEEKKLLHGKKPTKEDYNRVIKKLKEEGLIEN